MKFEHCCNSCSLSDGVKHDPECLSPHGESTDTDGDDFLVPAPVVSASDVESKLARLMSALPVINADMDYGTGRSILESICDVESIPRMDDKKFTLMFTKYSNNLIN
jgi:hypothetical protein